MGKDTKTRREKERGEPMETETKIEEGREREREGIRKRELEGTNGGGWLMFHHGE